MNAGSNLHDSALAGLGWKPGVHSLKVPWGTHLGGAGLGSGSTSATVDLFLVVIFPPGTPCPLLPASSSLCRRLAGGIAPHSLHGWNMWAHSHSHSGSWHLPDERQRLYQGPLGAEGNPQTLSSHTAFSDNLQ